MKIYLFNPENGIYLGEDFADEEPMRQGEYVIPPGATNIPPPQIGKGQILVFNMEEQHWDVRNLSHNRTAPMCWEQPQLKHPEHVVDFSLVHVPSGDN